MTTKDIVNVFKRFLIVFILVGIPLICVLTLVAKLSSFLVILIAVLVVGGIFVLEEYLYRRRMKKKLEKRAKENKK